MSSNDSSDWIVITLRSPDRCRTVRVLVRWGSTPQQTRYRWKQPRMKLMNAGKRGPYDALKGKLKWINQATPTTGHGQLTSSSVLCDLLWSRWPWNIQPKCIHTLDLPIDCLGPVTCHTRRVHLSSDTRRFRTRCKWHHSMQEWLERVWTGIFQLFVDPSKEFSCLFTSFGTKARVGVGKN